MQMADLSRAMIQKISHLALTKQLCLLQELNQMKLALLSKVSHHHPALQIVLVKLAEMMDVVEAAELVQMEKIEQ